MGYMMVYGHCWACKRSFMFNASYVPSFPDPRTGIKEPVCGDCMERVNAQRASQGLPAHPIHPEAYSPEEVI